MKYVMPAILAVVLFVSVPVWAASVHLKNGSVVTGRLVQKNADNVKMDVSGVTLTFYGDEYERIDEADAAPATSTASSQTTAERVRAVEPAAVPVYSSAAVPVDATPATGGGDAPASDKKARILKFIALFGTKDTMKANLEQMISTLPSEQQAAFNQAFSVDEIIELLVPLYAKYFNDTDLQALIDFYSSPAGRKLVENIPNIMKDSVSVSAKYFEEHMPPELKNVQPPATPAGAR